MHELKVSEDEMSLLVAIENIHFDLSSNSCVAFFTLHNIQGYLKGWDCKDDLKLFKYDDFKVK